MTQLNTEAVVGSLDKLIAERDAWKSLATDLNNFHIVHCDKLDGCSYAYRYQQLLKNNSDVQA